MEDLLESRLHITGIFCSKVGLSNYEALKHILSETLLDVCLPKISRTTIDRRLSLFTKRFIPNKPRTTKHRQYLLNIIGHFHCYHCDINLPTQEKANISRNMCKSCDREKSREKSSNYYDNNRDLCNKRSKEHYKANKESYLLRNKIRNSRVLTATPPWADKSKLLEVYRERPEGYEVDHIVPLNGVEVCGLHVHYNLQYLTKEDNLKKSNKLTGRGKQTAGDCT